MLKIVKGTPVANLLENSPNKWYLVRRKQTHHHYYNQIVFPQIEYYILMFPYIENLHHNHQRVLDKDLRQYSSLDFLQDHVHFQENIYEDLKKYHQEKTTEKNNIAAYKILSHM
jgi:hypothetical protein